MHPIRRPNHDQDVKISPGKIVEYEQHGKPILAVVVEEKRAKWQLLNIQGASLELPSERLFLLPGALPKEISTATEKIKFLQQLEEQALAIAGEANLEEAWLLLSETNKETALNDLCEVLFSKDSTATRLATRRLLIEDNIFFKRKKNSAFETRSREVVAELKKQREVALAKEKQLEGYLALLLERLKDPNAPLPDCVAPLEEIAALGKQATSFEEFYPLLENTLQRANLSNSGPPQEQAFRLLLALKHFNEHQNLTPLRLKRPVRFARSEVDAASSFTAAGLEQLSAGRKDLRHLYIITIDGAETKDFDDAISLEKLGSNWLLGVHITDVASLIAHDSLLDRAALRRATSIYCPDETFPMLPRSVSENSFSLIQGETRLGFSIFIEFDEQLSIVRREITKSIISVKQRLSYERADIMLCDEHQAESELHAMLNQLWQIAQASLSRRQAAGAYEFSRREKAPAVDKLWKVTLQEANEDTPARRVIEELMVLANESAALYGKTHGLALIYRSQEAPEVDLSQQGHHISEGPAREFFQRSFFKRSLTSTTPLPHFALGIECYAQVTSPIRRAVDLLNQRQLSTMLEKGRPYYKPEEMQQMLDLAQAGLDEAFQIQRERSRYWLLQYLVQEKIQTIPATVMRLDTTKPLAELDIIYAMFFFNPLAEAQLSLGQRVLLRIENIHPRKDLLHLRQVD